MSEKILFEIPIYSMPEEIFNERWASFKDKWMEDMLAHKHTHEDANKGYSMIFHPYNVWRYNQIIGYVTVSVSAQNVWFNEHRSLDKTYRYNTRTKHFIQDLHTGGCHFRVNTKDSDEHIKEQIIEWLDRFSEELSKKKYFLDCSTLENLIRYVNVRQAIDDMELET